MAVKTLKESASNKEKEDLVAEASYFCKLNIFGYFHFLCPAESDEDLADRATH